MNEREQQALLQFLYLIPFGVIKMAADGGVEFINPVAAEMLQAASPGISCENGWEALGHLDAALRDIVHSSGQQTGRIAGERRCVITRGAKSRHAAISIYRINLDCLMVILVDVSNLVNQEQAAEAAVRSKRDFLANVSHEMRTPLNGVIGITELLLETEIDSEQRNYLNIVKSSGESLLSVINDILDFAKVEAGKVRVDATAFSLRQLLEETLRTLSFAARKKGLQLKQEIDPGVPNDLIGDAGKLQQVLINLAGNAIKFTELGNVTIRVEQANQMEKIFLHFTVTDNGIGIPPEKQSAIFEAFTQADQSTSRLYGGTGLGLAICSRLVGLMGGRIWVESEVGAGSRFYFTAQFELGEKPVESRIADVSAVRPATMAGGERAGLRILLAEDNEVNRVLAVKMLENRGHRVVTASTGKQAIKIVEGGEIDVVFMDIQMPEMDGLQATAEIRKREAGSGMRVPIVAMTAHAMETQRKECLEAGMDQILTKPILGWALDEILLGMQMPVKRDQSGGDFRESDSAGRPNGEGGSQKP